MRRELPTFYYLDHFDQFIEHCRKVFWDILSVEHRQIINQVECLPKHTRATLVRALNRKPHFIRGEELQYDEIDQNVNHIDLLTEQAYLSPLQQEDITEFLYCLNKSELLLIGRMLEVPLKSSSPKPLLHKKVASLLKADKSDQRLAVINHERFKSFIRVGAKDWMSYFLFLYFGDTERSLSQFSLRDLGLTKARKGAKLNRRFLDQHNAEHAYQYLTHYRYVKLEDDIDQLIQFTNQHYRSKGLSTRDRLDFPETSEALADSIREKLIYKLARKISHVCKKTAIDIARHGKSDNCQEFYLRNRYHTYKDEASRDELKKELESHMQDPQSDTFFVFCRDFYERKYHRKTRSFYTDLLSRAENTLSIDEFFKNRVEAKVCERYNGQGISAWRTENRLWKSLFGLIFWELLYDNDEVEFASEFDRTPLSLKTGEFGSRYASQIDERLAAIDSAEKLVNQLLVIAALHYGTQNGVFRWSRTILDTAIEIIPYLPLASLRFVLKRMAENYHQLKDGFPDIALIENDKIIFEEIKAPGDKIRRNQLRAMRVLEDAGLHTRLCKVTWQRDFNQRYVVVDLETTGGRREGHRITEIGLVIVENQQVVDSWTTLINPQRRIPHNITKITGISNEMVADAPLFSEISDTLLEKLGDSIFVAHNVNFDFGFIQMELHRLDQHISLPKLCTVRESRETFKGLKSYSLKNLTAHFDITLENHHRALDDAKACAELLLLNFKAQQEKGAANSNIAELTELTAEESYVALSP